VHSRLHCHQGGNRADGAQETQDERPAEDAPKGLVFQVRDEAHSSLSKGINPRVHRGAQRIATRQADEYTFSVVFMRWMERYQLEISTGKRSTHERILRTFRKEVLPFLGKRPIHEIRHPDLPEVVGRVERRDALTTAQSIRGWLRRMFRYALVCPRLGIQLRDRPRRRGRSATAGTP
jgi:hypothetical protein